MFKPVRLNARYLSRTLGISILAIVTSACGYKGPLYLPPPPDTLKGQDNSTNNGSVPLESPHSQNIDLEPVQQFKLEPKPILIE